MRHFLLALFSCLLTAALSLYFGLPYAAEKQAAVAAETAADYLTVSAVAEDGTAVPLTEDQLAAVGQLDADALFAYCFDTETGDGLPVRVIGVEQSDFSEALVTLTKGRYPMETGDAVLVLTDGTTGDTVFPFGTYVMLCGNDADMASVRIVGYGTTAAAFAADYADTPYSAWLYVATEENSPKNTVFFRKVRKNGNDDTALIRSVSVLLSRETAAQTETAIEQDTALPEQASDLQKQAELAKAEIDALTAQAEKDAAAVLEMHNELSAERQRIDDRMEQREYFGGSEVNMRAEKEAAEAALVKDEEALAEAEAALDTLLAAVTEKQNDYDALCAELESMNAQTADTAAVSDAVSVPVAAVRTTAFYERQEIMTYLAEAKKTAVLFLPFCIVLALLCICCAVNIRRHRGIAVFCLLFSCACGSFLSYFYAGAYMRTRLPVQALSVLFCLQCGGAVLLGGCLFLLLGKLQKHRSARRRRLKNF